MKRMQEVVSEGGFARVGQLMLLLFFVPFILFLIYVVGKSFSLDGLIFASIIAWNCNDLLETSLRPLLLVAGKERLK